jgi:hypothetical protein
MGTSRGPVSDGPFCKRARNAEVRARHKKGESIATLAEVFGITQQRVWQILIDPGSEVAAMIESLRPLTEEQRQVCGARDLHHDYQRVA